MACEQWPIRTNIVEANNGSECEVCGLERHLVEQKHNIASLYSRHHGLRCGVMGLSICDMRSIEKKFFVNNLNLNHLLVPLFGGYYLGDIFTLFVRFVELFSPWSDFRKNRGDTQFLGNWAVPVLIESSVLLWNVQFFSYEQSKVTFILYKFFFGGSHTLFQTAGNTSMR